MSVSVKRTVWLPDDIDERVERMTERERRSFSNAVEVLVAEALEARDERAKRERR